MYQIYTFVIRDYLGDDKRLIFRGPIQSGNAQAEAIAIGMQNQLNSVINGEVISRSYGIETALPINPIPSESVNLLVIKAGYTTDNGVEKSLEIYSPNIPVIDFLQGDLIKLNKQPIKDLLDYIEDNFVDYGSGEGLNFDYAILIGKE